MKGHAEIAGGGIGGLCLGMLLAQRGWTVRVHERSEEIREIGAGIYIKNNSIKVMEEAGMFSKLAPRGTQLNRAEVRDREAVLATLQGQFAAIPSPTAPTRRLLALGADRRGRVGAIGAVLGDRVAWDRVLREVSAVLPVDVIGAPWGR